MIEDQTIPLANRKNIEHPNIYKFGAMIDNVLWEKISIIARNLNVLGCSAFCLYTRGIVWSRDIICQVLLLSQAMNYIGETEAIESATYPRQSVPTIVPYAVEPCCNGKTVVLVQAQWIIVKRNAITIANLECNYLIYLHRIIQLCMNQICVWIKSCLGMSLHLNPNINVSES